MADALAVQKAYVAETHDARLETYRYIAEVTQSTRQLIDIQAFRARCFGLPVLRDVDPWDAECKHIVVRRIGSGKIVGCCRFKLVSGTEIGSGYTAQFYDLAKLEVIDGRALELGRFCICDENRDPDILRLMWALLTGLVDQRGVAFLFGCASFAGTNPVIHAQAFALLQHEAQLRAALLPGRKAPDIHVFSFDDHSAVDRMRALQQMPPLLRCYLRMGAAVSDHAVVDSQLNTLHVFTLVETAKIPHARKKLLRGLRDACLVGEDGGPETN